MQSILFRCDHTDLQILEEVEKLLGRQIQQWTFKSSEKLPKLRHNALLDKIGSDWFEIATVATANMTGSSYRPAVEAIAQHAAPSGIAANVMNNVIRVAATRIFGHPEQNIVELVSNAIDASVKDTVKVGRFGMGFFSILYWLVEHPQLALTIITVHDNYGYCMEIRERDGRLCCRIQPHTKPFVQGTVVYLWSNDPDADIFSERQLKLFKMEMLRVHLYRKARIQTYDRSDGRWNYQQDPNLPVIYTEITSKWLIVQDFGSGIPIEVAIRELLTPSISTKPSIMETASTSADLYITLHVNTTLPISRSTIAISINGILVYMSARESSNLVAVIEMPSNTTIPVSRDNIILDSTSEEAFRRQIRKLMELAAKHEFKSFLYIEHALESYAEMSNQQLITNVISTELAVFYEKNSDRIVPPREQDVYASISDIFIAGSQIDTVRLRAKVIEMSAHLEKNEDALFKRTAIFLPDNGSAKASTPIVSSGGLYDVIFVRGISPKDEAWVGKVTHHVVDNMILRRNEPLRLTNSYTTFYTDLIRKIDNNVIPANKYSYDDRGDYSITEEWNRHTTTNHPLLASICNYLYDLSSCEITSDSCPPSNNNKLHHIEAILTDLVSIYGIYRQRFWYPIAESFAKMLFAFNPSNTSGIKPKVRVTSLKPPTGSSEAIPYRFNYCTKFLDLDVKIVKTVLFRSTSRMQRILTVLPIVTFGHFIIHRSTVKAPREIGANYQLYTVCFGLLAELPGSLISNLNAFLCMIIALRTEKGNPLQHFIEWWFREFAPYFNGMFISLITVPPENDFRIFGQSLKIRQAIDILQKVGIGISSEISVSQFDEPTDLNGATVYIVSTQELLGRIFSLQVDTGDEQRILTRPVSGSKLHTGSQLVSIATNDGSSRDFIVAVLQELGQNSIDAIKQSSLPETDRVITIGLYRDTGDDMVLTFHDPVGMDLSAIVRLLVPFYSNKSTNINATGEMGTGFFSVFRETAIVMIETVSQGVKHFCKSIPTHANGRVVDIENTIQTAPSDERNGTTISLFVKNPLKVLKTATMTRVAVNFTFRSIDPSIAIIRVRNFAGDYEQCNTVKHIRYDANQTEPIRATADGFQRGYFTVTVQPFTNQSVVTTNDTPFQSLAEFVKNQSSSLGNLAKYLENGFIVNIQKSAYDPIQSRTKLKFRSSLDRDDFVKCVLDMVWIFCMHLIHECIYVSDADSSQYGLRHSDAMWLYNISTANIDSKGDIDQMLPADERQRDYTLQDVILDAPTAMIQYYRPFDDFQAMSTLIIEAAKQCKTLNFPPKNAKNSMKMVQDMTYELVKSYPQFCRPALHRILMCWISTKEPWKPKPVVEVAPSVLPKENFDELTTNIDNTKIIPDSLQGHELVATFIETYVRFGCEVGITGFAKDMVKDIKVTWQEEGPSFFRDGSIVICERMWKGSPGQFKLICEWLKKNRTKLANRSYFELDEEICKHFPIFHQYFGARVSEQFGAVVIHELEHARRYKVEQTAKAADSNHGDYAGYLLPDELSEFITSNHTPKNRTFVDCQVDTFNKILATEVEGATFLNAWLSKLKKL